MGEDCKVIAVKVSAEMHEIIKEAARKEGLTTSVYIRTMLYKKFAVTE